MKLIAATLLFVGCSSSSKKAESEFNLASEFFKPLTQIRQLTCQIQIEVPAPLIAKQPALSFIQKENLRLAVSDAGCSVQPFKQAPTDVEDQKKYLAQLHKQIVFSHCVLLRAFQLRSPFEGFEIEDTILNFKEDDLQVQFREGSGWFRISKDRQKIVSALASGWQLSAHYTSSDAKVDRVKSIYAIDSKGQTLILEDFSFESRYSGIMVPSGFQVFTQETAGEAEAQMRVRLSQCIARTR